MDIEIKQTTLELIHFLQNPFRRIANIPTWTFKKAFAIQSIASLAVGAISGVLAANFYYIAYGVLIFPIVSLVSTLIFDLILYYYFQIFERRIVSYRRLYTLIVFSNMPFLLLSTLSQLFRPISVIGFALSGVILTIGLEKNFRMDKRRAIRLIAAVFIFVVGAWFLNQLNRPGM